MNRLCLLCATLMMASLGAFAQMPRNPIMFVTAVPNCEDSATQYSVIANQLGSFTAVVRGGDLWIRYADGSLRNLTQAAGYGVTSKVSETIAVRQPSVHWDGKRAVFSMLVGAYTSKTELEEVHWQLFEIKGFGKDETPVITKVAHQPNANNISPTYGTDDRILFTSDCARQYSTNSYFYLDESLGMRVNSGIWSLDAARGDLRQLDHAPSGDYDVSVDSYGRVLFSRWDILQHDQVQAISGGKLPPLTFNSEKNDAAVSNANIEPMFPEHNPRLDVAFNSSGGSSGYFNPSPPAPAVDPRTGTEATLFDPRLPSDFFPWAMNEDGSELQTVNHIGRHDLRDTIPSAITGDANITAFSSLKSHRANTHAVINVLQIHEDPLHPGSYYGIDALPSKTHSSGQIVRLDHLGPRDASRDVTVEYITPRITRALTEDKDKPSAQHSGLYRAPLPTTDGLLIASHTWNTYADARSIVPNTNSKFHFRLRTLKASGGFMVPDADLTPGIRKKIFYNNLGAAGDPLVQTECELWEMDAVEVVERPRPQQRVAEVDPIERAVFEEENVSLGLFRSYLVKKNLALVVSRDLTQRDKDDRQQPFYFEVTYYPKRTEGAVAPIYKISDVAFVQADYVRAHGTISGPTTNGRRVLPVAMHDVLNRRFDTDSSRRFAPSNAVHIAPDASMAALVPAQRAVCWQITNSASSPVVRERYWLSFAAGEVRTCARCHGENGEASVFSMPPPQNKAEALRGLLHVWKQDNIPSTVRMQSPANLSTNVRYPIMLTWKADSVARSYELVLKARNGASVRTLLTASIMAPNNYYEINKWDIPSSETEFEWTVRGLSEWGTSTYPSSFRFSTTSTLSDVSDVESAQLQIQPNPARDVIRVQCDCAGSGQATIIISDYLGHSVYTQDLPVFAERVDGDIPVDALPQGVYQVHIHGANGDLRRRIIIAR